MGCAQSRIENEESVSRCKERRNFIKEAVCQRNAFAAAHIGYGIALKNTGAALSDYAHGETEVTDVPRVQIGGSSLDTPAGPPSAMDPAPLPPPPPPPNFSPSPLQRAVTMPEFHTRLDRKNLEPIPMVIHEDDEGQLQTPLRDNKLGGRIGDMTPDAPLPPPSPPVTPAPPPPPELKGMAWDYFFMVDNIPGQSLPEGDDSGSEDDEDNHNHMFDEKQKLNAGPETNELEPRTPEKDDEETILKKANPIEHSNTAPPEFPARSRVNPNLNLLQIINQIDDHFLKASECAQEVSRMLEANRLHYHSNFADNRGHIDHSARVMQVITWSPSFKNSVESKKDVFHSEEMETHATVLDKLLAWEKKLYDEVKAGELMKLEYQRKIALLNKQKKNGVGTESLEKTKAAVSHLHTRYIVDMQSLDSTVSEVNHLRDDQLYPKLVSLVDGMANMWEAMFIHHDAQLKIAMDLKMLDVSHAPMMTTNQHYLQTVQLWKVIQEWHAQFDKLVIHQKLYVRVLTGWLKLNLIPIESSLKEKVTSPPKTQNPPIQFLLHSWHDSIEKLPDELAKNAISSFAAVMKTILIHQEEEMKLKEKCEETRKEFMRKNQAFDDWYQKFMQRRNGSDDPDSNPTDPVSERRFAVDSLRKRLEDEIDSHQRHCIQVREKSLGSLKTRLPEIFRAMSDYARFCSDAYGKLKSICQSQAKQ